MSADFLVPTWRTPSIICMPSTPSPLPFDDYTPPSLVITEHNVRRSFARLNERKAAGPDNIRPRLLKACSAQLAPVFTRIFNWSLELSTVPRNFKLSTIIPVPKKTVPAIMNDYRPVALTLVIMKCLEHIFLNFVKSLLPPGFDMFQFAYTANRGVEDAISININEILAHLETKKSYCRILFIDYSSAFNTIIPQKLYNKSKWLAFSCWHCKLDYGFYAPTATSSQDRQ